MNKIVNISEVFSWLFLLVWLLLSLRQGWGGVLYGLPMAFYLAALLLSVGSGMYEALSAQREASYSVVLRRFIPGIFCAVFFVYIIALGLSK
ncbi:hypothetical protein ACJJIX_03665 [Microbulbifer sp. VAAC004]|uniref:hypothetical protein n=1 Tax=unclassified Microbulbifer TaxID=2619833 RepID=UPI004039C87F